MIVDPDELAQLAPLAPLAPLATETIEVEEFVNLDQIDPVYFESSYYVAPHPSTKPYALLAKSLESSGKVAQSVRITGDAVIVYEAEVKV